jgi:hypothetical protein
MTSHFSPVLAENGQSLLDNPWLALFVILGSITAFVHAIIALKRSLSAPPTAAPARPAELIASARPASIAPLAVPPSPAPSTEPSADIFAAIAAAVAVTLGAKARVTAINAAPSLPGTEGGYQQWSLEGRRQIYSSHKVR